MFKGGEQPDAIGLMFACKKIVDYENAYDLAFRVTIQNC